MASRARAVRKRNPGPAADELFTDPRRFLILVRAERWKKHVLKKHKNLKPLYAEVMETIAAPDFITQSLIYPDRNVYYRRVDLPATETAPAVPLIAAVVKIDHETGKGELVTAYGETKKPEMERIIWTP